MASYCGGSSFAFEIWSTHHRILCVDLRFIRNSDCILRTSTFSTFDIIAEKNNGRRRFKCDESIRTELMTLVGNDIGKRDKHAHCTFHSTHPNYVLTAIISTPNHIKLKQLKRFQTTQATNNVYCHTNSFCEFVLKFIGKVFVVVNTQSLEKS